MLSYGLNLQPGKLLVGSQHQLNETNYPRHSGLDPESSGVPLDSRLSGNILFVRLFYLD